MNFEGPSEIPKSECEDINDSEHLNISNSIQIELLKKHPDWITEHASEFHEYMSSHPEVFEQYKQDPEGTVKEIEEKFYHK